MLRALTTRLAIALAAMFISCSLCWALEFEADLNITTNGHVSKGRVYVKNDYMRMEGCALGQPVLCMIAEKGNSTLWLFDKYWKLYWSISRSVPFNLLDEQVEYILRGKDSGLETIADASCRKVIYPFPGGRETRWYSLKLKIPLKVETEAENRHTILEYRNIKQRKQKDSFFMIQAGFANAEPDYWKDVRSAFGM